MNRATILSLRRMLSAMRQHDPDSTVGALLARYLPDAQADEVYRWLLREAERIEHPVVFSLEVPGFVLIGPVDDWRTVEAPRIAGLEIAHEVMMLGAIAHTVLNARDRGLSGNACRNALGRTAVWAERYSRALARAIRSIEIRRDGALAYQPPDGVTLILGGVCEACASAR